VLFRSQEGWGEHGWDDPTWHGQEVPYAEERHGPLPPWLPTVPTLAIAAVIVIIAFVLGRATAGGGGDSGASTTATTHKAQTTTTIGGTPSTVIVQAGQTLNQIASRNGLDVNALAQYNGITDINHVFVGEVIKIPPAGYSVSTTTPGTPTVGTTATTKKKG